MGTSGGVHSHIFEQIISLENLFEAWFDCIKGKRSRIDVQHFARDLEKHIFSLHDDLQKGTWCHGTYEHFRVADPKPRQIHKASVADRIVHHAIVRVIEPLFERSFIYDS